MEKSSLNQDNTCVEIETLREPSISVSSELAEHNFSAKQFPSLDLKTAYHSIKCNSKFCKVNKPLPFELKGSRTQQPYIEL